MVSYVDDFFTLLSVARNQHAPDSKLCIFLKQAIRKEVETLFKSEENLAKAFGPFGELVFPYHKMGSVDSLNLFDLDELIIFTFYWINRKRYKKVLDIGANLGLHSIILSKCGLEVRAYEPDSKNYSILQRNLSLNHCLNVEAFNIAVSNKVGEMEFVRVLGNMTSSHLAGSKANPYGQLERFPVKVEAIQSIIDWADLIKLDAEGHEKEILLATNRNHWLNRDALVEIGTDINAKIIFDYFKTLGVGMFAQKINWQPVCQLADVPTSYHEGTLFISNKKIMPWE